MNVESGMPGNDRASYLKIDHIAVAVRDIDVAVTFFCDVLGFSLMERREIIGRKTGMLSAELSLNGINLVLCQGTQPESQVSKLIEHYGPGVAHIALAVEDVEATANRLRGNGLEFDTPLISSPAISQIFSSRDPNSGLSFEFICRDNTAAFEHANIQQLFDALESSGKY